MSRLQRHFPHAHKLYMKIAPPRRRRLIYLAIYLLLAIAAVLNMFKPPQAMINLYGGIALVWMFLGFIIIGALLCSFMVLPGLWLFERVGLFSIMAGVSLYSLTLVFLGASIFVTIIPMIVVLLLALRLLDISEHLVAPTRED